MNTADQGQFLRRAKAHPDWRQDLITIEDALRTILEELNLPEKQHQSPIEEILSDSADEIADVLVRLKSRFAVKRNPLDCGGAK
tara:strand:- start:167 stop:418 length:252 start_codon:yes stop_codon:yes gene_type:complete